MRFLKDFVWENRWFFDTLIDFDEKIRAGRSGALYAESGGIL